MYIEPKTNIVLLKDVPLDKSYDHTIYFEDKEAQKDYFYSLKKYDLKNYSYQRVKLGVARVDIKADNLYDCNYIMFQNTSFGDKWFYAFITGVEYVNNETSNVYFELDVMQTWFFDCEPEYCFVEREHSETDEIGDNILPENVATGEYVFNDYKPVTDLTDMVVCVAVVDVGNGKTVDGTLYDGIYGSAVLYVYDSTDVQNINGKISEYVDSPDSVVSVYMFPKMLINEIPDNHRLAYGQGASPLNVVLEKQTSETTLNGYKPKNNKLYTYPYNFCHIDNASSGELTLRYEFFDELQPVVEIIGTVTQPITITLRPCSYKGVEGYTELGGYTSLNTESIQLNSFPVCSWNVDYYKAWLAQNSVPIVTGALSKSAEFALLGAATSKSLNVPVGSAIISQVSNIIGQNYTASIAADISKGNFSNGNVNSANHMHQFYYGRCSVTKEFAKMIDDYFSVYGYSTRMCKKPNRSARPHWNYVKTLGCTITGSVPADDMKKICEIYDKGITFWKNGNEVGDYSLDNSL